MAGVSAPDRLEALLSGAVAREDADPETRALLDLTAVLSQAVPAVPATDEDFRARLRAQLVDAARERATTPRGIGARVAAMARGWSVRVAGVTGGVALVLSTGGTALAAERAMPGDLLYGVRLGLEDVQMLIERDPVARAERALLYASERVAEASAVARAGNGADAEPALLDAAERTREATPVLASGTAAQQAALAAFVAAQQSLLEELLAILPPQAAAAAAEALAATGEAAQALPEGSRPDLVPPVLDDVEAPDAAGDVAAPVPDAAAAATDPVVEAVTEVVAPAATDAVGTATEALPDPVQDAVEDVQDAVDDVTGAVEDALPPAPPPPAQGPAAVPPPAVPVPQPQDAGDAVESTAGAAGEVVETSVDTAADGVSDAADSAGDAVGGPVGEAVQDAGQVVEDVADTVGDAAQDVTDTVGETVGDTTDDVTDALGGLLGGG